jgi:hypothetical protein
MVFLLANNPGNSTIYYEHGTGPARSHFTVEGCSFYGNTPFCGLTDSILFRMYGSYTVGGDGTILVDHFFKLMAHLIAMGQACWSSHITGYQDLIILGNYTA